MTEPLLRAHDYPQYAEALTDLARALAPVSPETLWHCLTTARVVVPVVALVCLEYGCRRLAACTATGVCRRLESR